MLSVVKSTRCPEITIGTAFIFIYL